MGNNYSIVINFHIIFFIRLKIIKIYAIIIVLNLNIVRKTPLMRLIHLYRCLSLQVFSHCAKSITTVTAVYQIIAYNSNLGY